jgi:hypothetical protein
MRVSGDYRIVSPLRGSQMIFRRYPGLTPWATFLTRLPALFDVLRCIPATLKFLVHGTTPPRRGWGW